MVYLSGNDLKELLKEIEEFESFVKKMKPDKVPYFIRYLDRMKYNIKTYITLSSVENEKILGTLRRDWNEAKDVFLEIPGFYANEINTELEKEKSFEFFEHVMNIDAYVKKHREQI